MQEQLMDVVIASCRKRYGKKVRRVVIDLDPTYDSLQLTFFNDHYGNHCYLPLMGFISFDDHPEQHMVAAILRSGLAPGTECTEDLLDCLCQKIREQFPKSRILIRLDGAFSTPSMLEWLDRAPKVDYVLNFAKNAVLKRKAEMLMKKAATQ